MRNELEMRLDEARLNRPNDCIRGLQCERHHHQGQQRGQNSARDVPPVQQYPKTPNPMVLRRGKLGNSLIEFTLVSLNSLAHTCRTSPSRATIL
jgi:hypothetical protein